MHSAQGRVAEEVQGEALPVKGRESNRAHRSQEMARSLGELVVSTSMDSFEELEPKFKTLERRLLARSSSAFERREIRRRIAEALLTQSFANDCAWAVFKRALRRIQRLGYSSVDRRYHVAAIYALWCERHPEHDRREARFLLDEAEERIRRLPRRNVSREEMLKGLAEVRAQTGFHCQGSRPGVVPPGCCSM